MQLKVKVIKGQEETAEVENDLATVYDIKKILESKTSIPIKLQSLVYKGKPLADGNSLAHYSIKDGDKLFVVEKVSCESERTHVAKEEVKKTTDVAADACSRDGGSSNTISAVVDRATALHDPEQRCSYSVNLPTSIPPHQCGGCWKPKTRFWERLNTFLQRHFAQDDVDKIIRVVCEDMRKSVYEINLDAVEFLATEQLKAMQTQRESGGIQK